MDYDLGKTLEVINAKLDMVLQKLYPEDKTRKEE